MGIVRHGCLFLLFRAESILSLLSSLVREDFAEPAKKRTFCRPTRNREDSDQLNSSIAAASDNGSLDRETQGSDKSMAAFTSTFFPLAVFPRLIRSARIGSKHSKRSKDQHSEAKTVFSHSQRRDRRARTIA